jgi:Resolvase, N terminal domain
MVDAITNARITAVIKVGDTALFHIIQPSSVVDAERRAAERIKIRVRWYRSLPSRIRPLAATVLHVSQRHRRAQMGCRKSWSSVGLIELREIAGCETVKVYKDHGISGAKGRDKRPAFNALCRDAAQRKFGIIIAWSLDRLGRSLQDLLASSPNCTRCGLTSSYISRASTPRHRPARRCFR